MSNVPARIQADLEKAKSAQLSAAEEENKALRALLYTIAGQIAGKALQELGSSIPGVIETWAVETWQAFM